MSEYTRTDRLAAILEIELGQIHSIVEGNKSKFSKLGGIRSQRKKESVLSCGIRCNVETSIYLLNADQCRLLLSVLSLELTEHQKDWLVSRGILVGSDEKEKRQSPTEKLICSVDIALAIGVSSVTVSTAVMNSRKSLEAIGGSKLKPYPTKRSIISATGRTSVFRYDNAVDLTPAQAVELLKGLRIFPLSLNKVIGLTAIGVPCDEIKSIKGVKKVSRKPIAEESPRRTRPDSATDADRRELIDLCDRHRLSLCFGSCGVAVYSGGECLFVGGVKNAIGVVNSHITLKDKASDWVSRMKGLIVK